ncbi:hypothetical protein ACU5EH_22365 [Aliivibrio salmonicida]|uniref:hypothetical protein n=1 Tax=Aliivibrio salmonicida TaxID=40269 RepID=UPI00406C4B32
MNSTILKPICIVLSIATASLSAILTAQFMYGIGLAMGEPVLMTALGIVLDLAKCATPLFILFLFSQKQYASAFFALAIERDVKCRFVLCIRGRFRARRCR